MYLQIGPEGDGTAHGETGPTDGVTETRTATPSAMQRAASGGFGRWQRPQVARG